MIMEMVTAIVRTTSLDRIVEALKRVGIQGMTIFQVRGFGEQVTPNAPYSLHEKIEIMSPDTKAAEVMQIILEHAKSGLAGDGLVAVLPVESLVKIRSGEKIDEGTSQRL
jgi:nitrogen regulatory protein P-II 1